jgi:hypothetical protein
MSKLFQRAGSGEFIGRYSDGRSAVAHAARVTLAAGGLTIGAPEMARPVTWAYSTLRSARPVRGAGEVLLTTGQDETATLFVSDPAFGPAVARLAPQLTRSGRFRRRAAPWAVAGGVLAALIAGIWALDLSPAHGIARLLPDRARAALGRQTIDGMTKGKRVCEAPEGRAALDRLMTRLTQTTDGKRFRIIVVDWSLMNAFAVPGEQIVLTSGLIAKAEAPDEVAGVLAHEIGHGLAMDPETGIVRSVGILAVADLLFGTGALTNLGVQLAQLSYTRKAEHNADLSALKVLKGAEISAQGFLDFFKRVQKFEDGKALKAPGILRSHPVTAERIRLVEEQGRYAATPSMTPADWAALRAICPPLPEKPAKPEKPKDGN